MTTTRHCPSCGFHFAPWGHRGGEKRFCSSDCQKAFAARSKVEGALIINLAKAWRQGRGKAGTPAEAFKEMVSILDYLIERDREAGRPNVSEHVGRLLRDGRFLDRLRSR